MSSRRRRRRHCAGCQAVFEPDARRRGAGREQKYCSKPECRRASKVAAQRRWLAQNREQFKGPENSQRVRDWRAAHPGYWRRNKGQEPLPLGDALQDVIDTQVIDQNGEIDPLNLPLQDLMAPPAARLVQLRLHF